MKRILIVGAGNLGGVLAKELSQEYEIVGYLDNNSELWKKEVSGYKVYGGTSKIHELAYDEIVIASTMRYEEIHKALALEGITDDKYIQKIQTRILVEVEARVNFLRDFAKMNRSYEVDASVAEGGISRNVC